MQRFLDTAFALLSFFLTCPGVTSFISTPTQDYLPTYEAHKPFTNHHSLNAVPIENESRSSRSLDRQSFQDRGKVNEVDFCMAPSDVSLSRSYGNVLVETATNTPSSTQRIASKSEEKTNDHKPRIVSLTRALNSVSNRAVRRILLSRSWPSPEALNLSLRQVLASDKKVKPLAETEDEAVVTTEKKSVVESSTAKCPVPRPILNIIMRRSQEYQNGGQLLPSSSVENTVSPVDTTSVKRQRKTDEDWIQEQMEAFRLNYGQVPGYYEYADAYLECILDLATTGIESDRVSEVLSKGVYDDSYRRVLLTIKSVGAVFEAFQSPDGKQKMKIAAKLIDQDICLSMLDKIAQRNEKKGSNMHMELSNDNSKGTIILDPVQAVGKINNTIVGSDLKAIKEKSATLPLPEVTDTEIKTEPSIKKRTRLLKFLSFFKPRKEESLKKNLGESSPIDSETQLVEDEEDVEPESTIKPEDLGAMLLSAEEPTITRQLNILANVVKRALLFGGDDEILVLFETMEADKPAFIQRWYKDTIESYDDPFSLDPMIESRPGVQFYNCLTQLLKNCYSNGEVSDLNPPFSLSPGYMNAYERLTGTLVELGSGYINPINAKNTMSVLPKTPTDELSRFSQWEASFRKNKAEMSDYPDDFVGTWQVKDELGGKTLGTSTVVFKAEGEVFVKPPLKGLRWRLDPGPTHLDTCTWQVLSHDGAVLQYKGFIDRGARLEARFSKRPINIRGAVTFQMRDGGETISSNENYKRDMLPVIARTGNTRFVMSKVFDLNEDLK